MEKRERDANQFFEGFLDEFFGHIFLCNLHYLHEASVGKQVPEIHSFFFDFTLVNLPTLSFLTPTLVIFFFSFYLSPTTLQTPPLYFQFDIPLETPPE